MSRGCAAAMIIVLLASTEALLRSPRLVAPRSRQLQSRAGRIACSWRLLGQPKPCGVLVLVRHGETSWDAEDRFTGWADPHLSESGKLQVDDAARALLESGFAFDVAYTSMLKRAVETTWLLLKELGLIHLPVWKDWRLNDRSYGSLTGHSIDEMRNTYGDSAVQSWRRSFDSRPPPFQEGHPFDPASSRRYARWEDRNGNVQPVQLPGGESLGDTIARCAPVWRDITRDLKEGKNVLVAAHGNSIRAIVQVCESTRHAWSCMQHTRCIMSALCMHATQIIRAPPLAVRACTGNRRRGRLHHCRS